MVYYTKSVKKNKTNAQEWAQSKSPATALPDWMLPLNSLLPGTKVILCCRESKEQNRLHLKDQKKILSAACEKNDLDEIGYLGVVAKGDLPDVWLTEIVQIAERENAVLLFATVSRAIRPPHFNPHKPKENQLTPSDFAKLKKVIGNVKVALLVHSLDEREEKDFQSSVQTGKTCMEKMKRLRELKPVAIGLKGKMSVRKIAQHLGIHNHSTVQKWLKER